MDKWTKPSKQENVCLKMTSYTGKWILFQAFLGRGKVKMTGDSGTARSKAGAEKPGNTSSKSPEV